MTYLDGIAHWLKYEFDVDVLLSSDLALALEKLRRSEAEPPINYADQQATGRWADVVSN